MNMVDKSDLGSIDLDDDVVGHSKLFVIPNILEPTRSIDDDLHALVGKSW